MSSAVLRKQHHESAKSLMAAEEYFAALELLRRTQITHGSHLGIRSDIAAILYLQGRVRECEEEVSILQSELDHCEAIVSNDTFCRTKIFLGKMYEDHGRVSLALQCYEDALRKPLSDGGVIVRAQSQLLRLRSFLKLKQGLPELYKSCCLLKAKSDDLSIELEHAVLLAELSLFGVEFAEGRLMSLLQLRLLSAYDRNLLIVDFLETAMSLDHKISALPELVSSVHVESMNIFERTVFSFASNSEYMLTAKDCVELSRVIPGLGYLRILALNLKRIPKTPFLDECRRVIMFSLSSLRNEDRSLLKKHLQIESSDSTPSLVFLFTESKIRYQDRQKSIKRNSFSFQLFNVFSGKNEISVDEFALKLYGVPLDVSIFERIRVGIYRLNQEISDLTGFSKAFALTKNSVTSTFDIIRVDSMRKS